MSNIDKVIQPVHVSVANTKTFPLIGWLSTKIIKHQNDHSIKNTRIGDLTISYIKPYELLHTYKDIFEDQIYHFNSSSKNPLILDCGSNIGISVLYFKSIYPESKVIGFEPDSNNHSILTENIHQNNLTNVEIEKKAVWIHNEGISFHGLGTEASRIEKNESGTTKVQTIRLKEVLQKLNYIDFLKLDIEGAEYEVMKDIQGELNKVENLFLEYHGKTDESGKITELLQIVSQSGFKIYVKNAADFLKHPFSEKHTVHNFDVQLNIFCFR